jgi:hydrogenase nickel incorporation protein HypB
MCQECGCGLGGQGAGSGGRESAGAAPAHPHEPPHAHEAESPHKTAVAGHAHDGPVGRSRLVELNRSLLEKNARLAERNRGFFRAKKLLVLNVMSSPGSGKTTFIRETAARLRGRLRVGVITGDLATENDAATLRAAGVPVVQINTGTVCHLDAEMVAGAARQLELDALEVLVIENVGNLVCPADYDLGEDLRVVLLSVAEGEDKPLKYPPLFHSAHVAVVTKTDLAAAAGFDREQALANLKRISHHARIFEVSAKTGDGMSAWVEFLQQEHAARGHAGWL